MKSFTFDAPDEEATARLGQALAAALPDGAVVGLIGPLGAGKTRLVQALARAEGVGPGEVSSPTFVLVHEYQGRRPILHCDAYRLAGPADFQDLGLDEPLAAGALLLVEWADKVADYLPAGRLDIHIEVTGAESRRFTLKATTAEQGPLVAAVAQAMSSSIP